eukprot:4470919-Pyramimonas_sp.AAC.1
MPGWAEDHEIRRPQSIHRRGAWRAKLFRFWFWFFRTPPGASARPAGHPEGPEFSPKLPQDGSRWFEKPP